MDVPTLALGDDPIPAPFPAGPAVSGSALATPRALAPWWHTLLIFAVFATTVSLGRLRHSASSASRLSTYASQILYTWLLFGAAISGIRDRETFFRDTLLRFRKSIARELRRGIAVYFIAGLLAGTLAVSIRAFERIHEIREQRTAQDARTNQPDSTSKAIPSTARQPARKLFDTSTLHLIAPQTFPEWLTWLLVSITAGFCEELVFRGYLLSQALTLFTRMQLSPALAAVFATLATSLLFGSLHIYQGLGGAAVVTVLGLVYATVALKFGTLRSVILAHITQDALAGTILFLRHLHHAA